MTENQPNKNYETSLAECRADIDAIDNQLIYLLAQRMKIVEKVRVIKTNSGEKVFIKSAREADMIKNLIAKADPILPKSVLVNIWRKIITSSNLLEQPLKLAVHNPHNLPDYNYLVREYYTDFIPIITHDSVNNVVSEIEKNAAQIAIFALPHSSDENFSNDLGENWWINLANNNLGLKVFTRIPFTQNPGREKQREAVTDLVALAIKTPEKSQQDCSLFCIELANTVSKAQLLATLQENGFDAKLLKIARLKRVDDIIFYLVEVKGFLDENSAEIKQLMKHKIKPFVKALGVYPESICN